MYSQPISKHSEVNGPTVLIQDEGQVMKAVSTEPSHPTIIELQTYTGALMILINDISMLQIYNKLYWALQYAIPVIHMVLMMFSPFLIELWNGDDTVNKVVRIFSSILTFSPKSMNNQFDLAGSLAIALIYLIFGVIFAALPRYFIEKGNYQKWMVYFSAVVTEIIPPLLLLPFAANICYKVADLAISIVAVDVVLIIFLVLAFGFAVYTLIFTASFNTFLLHPNPSPFSSFQGKHPAYALAAGCVYVVITKFAYAFEYWLAIITIVIHIAVNAYLIFDTFNYPFVHLVINPIAASIYSATIISHLLTILNMFLKIPSIVRIIVPFAALIIALIAYILTFRSMTYRIRVLLSDQETQTDVTRREYYDSLGLSTQNSFTRFIHVGMSSFVPLILDWTFLIYYCDFTHDMGAYITSGLYVSFFPAEQQAAQFFIGHITKEIPTKFVQKYAVYRIRSLYFKRFSNDSEDATASLSRAVQSSDDLLTAIRNFWKSIQSNKEYVKMSDLEAVSTQQQITKDMWKQGLSQFPNDSRFTYGYSSYLLECMVNLEKGAIMRLKSQHLEKGLHADVDQVFRSLAICFPCIIHEKKTDKMGNIKRDGFDLTTGTTMTISATALEKLEEDINAGAIDKMLVELYQWPNLRKSLARATSKYQPQLNKFGVTMIGVSLLVWIALMIVSLIFFIPIFQPMENASFRFEQIMNVRQNEALLKIALMMKWAEKNGKLYDQTLLEETLDADARSETVALKTGDFDNEMLRILTDLDTAFTKLIHLMSNEISTLDDPVSGIEVLSNNSLVADVCFGSQIYKQNMSIKTAVAQVIWDFVRFSSSAFNYTNFENNNVFCLFLGTDKEFHSALQTLVEWNLGKLDEIVKETKQKTNIIIVFTFIITFVIVLPSGNLLILIYYREVNTVLTAIKSIDREAAQRASERIVINSNDDSNEKDFGATILPRSIKYTIVIIIHIALLVGIIAFECLFTSTLITGTKENDKIINWVVPGSSRGPIVMESMGYITEYLSLKLIASTPIANPTLAAGLAKQSFTDLSTAEADFYSGTNFTEGIKDKFKDITDLHGSDRCSSSGSTTTHAFYKCIALERLIFTYINLATSLLDPNAKFQSSDFIEIYHMATGELYRLLQESRSLLHNHLTSSLESQKLQIILSIVFELVFYVFVVYWTMFSIQRLKRILNTGLVLVRRIPPPSISNCIDLKCLLLGRSNNNTEANKGPLQVVFDNLPTAVLTLSNDETIESMNEKAKTLFGFLSGQIVGQKLECLIQKIEKPDTDDLTEVEIGTINLYKELHEMTENPKAKQQQTFLTVCRTANDVMLNVEATLCGIVEISGVANNFVLFLRETEKEAEFKRQMYEAKEVTSKLMNQLIPSTVQGFIRDDRKDFAFIAKTSTVVAIQIVGFYDEMKRAGTTDFITKISHFYNKIDVSCVKHPPMMRQKQVCDLYLAIGGLFNEDTPKAIAQSAIAFSMEIVEDTVHSVENFGLDFRVQIGITTGGPLLCGLIGSDIKEFNATGHLIEEAMLLAENSMPCRIAISEGTRNILENADLEKSPDFDKNNNKVWFVPNFIDNTMLLPSFSHDDMKLKKDKPTPPSGIITQQTMPDSKLVPDE